MQEGTAYFSLNGTPFFTMRNMSTHNGFLAVGTNLFATAYFDNLSIKSASIAQFPDQANYDHFYKQHIGTINNLHNWNDNHSKKFLHKKNYKDIRSNFNIYKMKNTVKL